MTSIALGKQSTNTGDVRRFSERRTSSASLKHLPRAFQLREDFLAQTAAEACESYHMTHVPTDDCSQEQRGLYSN